MAFRKVTEEPSNYRHLEKMSVKEIIYSINKEDQQVASAVGEALPDIEKLIEAVSEKMLKGGRLFYIGAGTSGRLGILDASECPPTYGVPVGLVVGVIAGGEKAMVNAIENAEDNADQGWQDLVDFKINNGDFVIGIATSLCFMNLRATSRRSSSARALIGTSLICASRSPGSAPKR